MDRWTFGELLRKDEPDMEAIKVAFNEVFEAWRLADNTLRAVSAVISIRS